MNITPEEVALWLEGETTQVRAEAIARAVAENPTLQEEVAQQRALHAWLAQGDAALDTIDLTATVREGLARPSRKRTLHWAAMALAAVAAGVFLLPQDAVRTKAGKSTWNAMHVYRAARPPQRVEQTVTPSDSLLFTYDNAGPEPFSFLMIYAIDSAGDLHWYYPAYVDAGRDPTSVRIEKGERILLPEAVTHALPSGPVVFYALFTRDAVHVSTIENHGSSPHDSEVDTQRFVVEP